MGTIQSPTPVKLFFGMLSPEPSLFARCADILCREYGPLDFESGVWPWEKTGYYRAEMGAGLLRKFIFCERLIDPSQLPAVKIFTNAVEKEFTTAGSGPPRRRINIDPGYVTEAKVVLATTKDFSHRIYIDGGIYAEVTLRYNTAGRDFTAFDYTYPDYRTDAYRTLFNNARKLLRSAMKKS
ncbi:MAG TPA: DUF4416 family protein [Nitrospirota bacterium]